MVEIITIDERFRRNGREAADDGRQAFLDGKPKDANPYEDMDPYLALQWGRAWCQASYSAQIAKASADQHSNFGTY